MNSTNYIGRFAPSPTGPLHYGSLVAATASYLQAKHNEGKWYVRIEDIDPPREIQGATDDILATLECYQFEWDQEPLYQSTRLENYRTACDALIEQQLVYACNCSRKDLADNIAKTELGKRYPGICADKQLPTTDANFNLRVRVQDQAISFHDLHYGLQTHNLQNEIGDIVIYRKFNLPSYSLAVVMDDAIQGITEVVRGVDLIAFTPIQIYLCELLQLPVTKFLHIPIIVNQQGQKLSKQTHAPAISKNSCVATLTKSLNDLGQEVPEDLAKNSLSQLWSWAIEHWDVHKIPQTKQIFYKQ